MTYVEDYGADRTRSLGPDPTLHDPVSITESELGAWTEVRQRSRLNESAIGDYTYLMEDVQLDFTTIGKFGNVAAAARLGPTNHPIDRPTAHHFTYRAAMYDLGKDDESIFEWRADQPVEVGHDVWIGHGAIVLPGVSIGDGAVVGAGAVVADDVAPYSIVAGVPAEPIRRRFPEDIAARIAATEWWDWDHETLRERLDDFRDLETFLDRHAPETADPATLD
ncbi:acetyltransferase [Haloarcula taiwanensis]|uniref:Acetyltransferase n=1 Tax=Haloarcula taiwanensis TaxID=1932004 RepID=A0A2H5A3I7_9EURY|nr:MULTISPECIES: DapH/DapD/GlmU-related protein [Haloarcula]AUG49316.1 acetyltransferase [Haloarcula taiwanensis]RLM34683.1 acetyltransferase [Haloarcula sp. Atlit-120R]RLM44097.1 acetyltransferase [Haloarcula sp. Atlit-47R]RLM94981.1 acetyltransferase [Haloarcula sp. Atlit-7R]